MLRPQMLRQDSAIGRAIGLALFLLPIGYIAEIAGVAVHEILGHGLCAAFLGGEFSGFVLKWDAMGWAFCGLPSAAPPMHEVLYLASGVVAEIVCGLMLWGLVSFFRRRPDLQLALLVTSSACLLSGTSYVLWNAYHPVPPGDIGRIVWLSVATWPDETSAIRWVLLVVGAVLFSGATLYFYTAVFVRIEALILRGASLAGGSRLLVLLVFLVLPDSIGWLVFDWDQLAPGIGWLPRGVGALSVVAVAGLLFRYRPKWKHDDAVRPITRRQVVVSWLCLLVTILILMSWAEDGITW